MHILSYVAITHPGLIREKNEDNFFINGEWKCESEDYYHTKGAVKEKMIAGVCDGMGGHTNGQRASFLAVSTMAEYEKSVCREEALRLEQDPMCYVNWANQCICDEMRCKGTEMGTTMAMLDFYEGYVVAENIGDSSIYFQRRNELKKISVDHTVVERLFQKGHITEDEIKNHPMAHRLTQYLGILPEEMILEPTVTTPMKIRTGDHFLICSDGLTDMLTKKEILEIMKKRDSLEEKSEQLVSAALKAGGKDNITIILIQVERGKGLWNIK